MALITPTPNVGRWTTGTGPGYPADEPPNVGRWTTGLADPPQPNVGAWCTGTFIGGSRGWFAGRPIG